MVEFSISFVVVSLTSPVVVSVGVVPVMFCAFVSLVLVDVLFVGVVCSTIVVVESSISLVVVSLTSPVVVSVGVVSVMFCAVVLFILVDMVLVDVVSTTSVVVKLIKPVVVFLMSPVVVWLLLLMVVISDDPVCGVTVSVVLPRVVDVRSDDFIIVVVGSLVADKVVSISRSVVCLMSPVVVSTETV